MSRLPPLNAVRAFEAAGRHLSFTKAAAELHVTQAAVSQQVKLLEDYLNQPLFIRDGRVLSLTENGAVFLRRVGAGLDEIALATRQFVEASAEQTLIITTLASFAGSWLLPRLNGFQREYPDIRVRIDTGNALVALKHADVHGAIRYGRGQYLGLDSALLFDETLFPVCSPELWRSLGQSTDVELLDRAPLIYDVESPHHWQRWLETVGYPERRPKLSLAFNESQLMIKAAEDHMGIALGRRELVTPGIEAGRLVAPFGEKMPSQFAYYWVTDPARHDYPPLRCFRDWLMMECERYIAQL